MKNNFPKQATEAYWKEKLSEERSLPIKNEQGDYSREFIELLRPYYIIFPS